MEGKYERSIEVSGLTKSFGAVKAVDGKRNFRFVTFFFSFCINKQKSKAEALLRVFRRTNI